MEKLKVVLTGGGTGGHVYPNIAIYEEIKNRYPDSEFIYIGTAKGAEKKIVENLPHPMEFREVKSAGLPRRIKSLRTFGVLWKVLMGAFKSYTILRKFRPDIVVGSGGFVAAPVLVAAALLKCRVFLHEQNAVPGRLNRMMAGIADKIGVSFVSTVNFFPKGKGVFTGYPLRKAINLDNNRDEIKKKLGIPDNNRVIFAFGGSMGARTINSAMVEIIPTLISMKDITLIMSTGRGYSGEYKAYDDTISKLEKIGIASEVEGKLMVREYFDNIEEIYSITDLVISRAGAGTIKEITTLGLPSILIPKTDLPGDHQILNAVEVQKVGGARLVFEEVENRDGVRTIYVPEFQLLRTVQTTLNDADALDDMRSSLGAVEHRNSGELILAEIENIVDSGIPQKIETERVYILDKRKDRSHELLFDDNLVGESVKSDIRPEDMSGNPLFRIRYDKASGSLSLKALRGVISVNDKPVKGLVKIHKDDVIKADDNEFIVRTYNDTDSDGESCSCVKPPPRRNIMGHALNLFARLMIFSREIFLAAFFGAGKVIDSFGIAVSLVEICRGLTGEKALTEKLAKIFTSAVNRDNIQKIWQAVSTVFNLQLIGAIILTVLGILFSQTILYGEELYSEIFRIMIPYVVLSTTAGFLSFMLNQRGYREIVTLSVALLPLSMITIVPLTWSFLGVYSISAGFIGSGAVQLIFLLVFMLRSRKKSDDCEAGYKPVIQLSGSYFRKFMSTAGSESADRLFNVVPEFVGRMIALTAGVGSVSYLYFVQKIFKLPFELITYQVNRFIFKDKKNRLANLTGDELKSLFLDGVNTNVFLLVPVSIIIFVLAPQLVTLFLERFSFTAEASVSTATVLMYYAPGLIGWGIYSFTSVLFNSRMAGNRAFRFDLLMFIVHIALILALANYMDPLKGIALASSVTYILFGSIRIVSLYRQLKGEGIDISSGDLLKPVVKTLTASLLMIIVLAEGQNVFTRIALDSGILESLVHVVSLAFIGVAVYLMVSLILKNSEILKFRKKGMSSDCEIPVSMLSPSGFLGKVARDPEKYREDYMYKINIYITSNNWAVRNTGIKLAGVFKDQRKAGFLIKLLSEDKENGFVRRNAVTALNSLGIWNLEVRDLMMKLTEDPYYEVRVAAYKYLLDNIGVPADYDLYREKVNLTVAKGNIEEKLACIRLIAKYGSIEDLALMNNMLLGSNSLLREELVRLLHSFYKRELIDNSELDRRISGILITSNNLVPVFKLKSIIKNIYREID